MRGHVERAQFLGAEEKKDFSVPGQGTNTLRSGDFYFFVRCVWHIPVISETADKVLGAIGLYAAFRTMTVEPGLMIEELVEEETEPRM